MLHLEVEGAEVLQEYNIADQEQFQSWMT